VSFRESAQGDRGKTVGDARALTAQNHQLMAEGGDSKAPFQMIANLDLQTLHIGLKARFDLAKLNLMLSSDCSQIGTRSSNPLVSVIGDCKIAMGLGSAADR
jgi:hypothetical protein